MSKPESSPFEFVLINNVMNDDYRTRVVKTALAYRSSLSKLTQNRLAGVIDNWVDIQGFRRGHSRGAKPAQILPGLTKAFTKRNPVTAAVLQAWTESQGALADVVQKYLESHSEISTSEIDWQVGFRLAWSTDDMDKAKDSVIGENPSLDGDDVALMLCIKSGRLPVQSDQLSQYLSQIVPTTIPAQDGTLSPQDSSDRKLIATWQSIIEELSTLPSEAPEWDQIEDLIAELKKLSSTKIELRKNYHQEIELLIQEIKEVASVELKFFEFAGIDQWQASQLLAGQAQTLVGQLQRFKAELLSYHELSLKEADTLAERREQRQILAEKEITLQSQYADLQVIFGVGISNSRPPLGKNAFDGILPSQQDQDYDNPDIAEHRPRSEDTDTVKTSVTVTPERHEQSDHETTLATEPPAQKDNEKEEKPEVYEGLSLAEDTAQSSLEAVGESTPSTTLSATEIAQKICSGEDSEMDQEFIWALIAEGEIPLAYWAAKSKEDQGEISPVPFWILEAVYGSLQLNSEHEAFVGDLLELSKKELAADIDKNALSMLLVAAAIKPTIIAPYSGLSAWLQRLNIYEPLDNIIDAVIKFAEQGIPLHPADVDAVAGGSQRSNALQGITANAQKWLSQAPMRKFKLHRAGLVWRNLISPNGELHSLLKTVSEDKRSEVENVQGQVDQWWQREYLNQKIDKIDSDLVKLKSQPIIGSAKEQLEHHIQEALSIASEWCHAVRYEQQIASRGNWILEQVNLLRSELAKYLEPTLNELYVDSTSKAMLKHRAGANCLYLALLQVAELFQLPLSRDFAKNDTVYDYRRQMSRIADDLRQYLVLCADLDLADNLEALYSEKVFNSIVSGCSRNIQFDIAFQEWLQKQDYRFVRYFEGRINGDPSTLAKEHISSSQGHLRDLRNNVQNVIEQAVVDGIIADTERAAYSDRIEQVDPEAVLNFHAHYSIFNQIIEDVKTAKENRLQELIQIWEVTSKAVQASDSISSENKKKLSDVVEQSVHKGDTRLVEEFIARIKPILDIHKDWDEGTEKNVSDKAVFEDFIQTHVSIDELLTIRKFRLESLAKHIKEGNNIEGLVFSGLSTPRRDDAERAIHSWRQLKTLKNERNGPTTKNLLVNLLNYLGFVFDNKINDPVSIEAGDDWLHAKVSMSDSGLAKPIYHFGSRADGRYHVICLWERPGAETIASRIRQLRLKNDNLLIFFLGRLGLKQRESLIRLSYDERFNLVVLDEILLIYLAQEKDSRLNAFLRCTIPFSSFNPYTPFQAGDVPSEMFYGRQDMIRTLQLENGSCIVYGGRQLGKSALLKQVEREFNNPEREQYASVQDIKLIGDRATQQTTDGLWRKLREAFKDLGLFNPEVRTDRPEEIEKHIRKALEENKQRRVLILFDEADNFLDADANQNFRVTERLRALMVETNRRFKVVFAGLHNVQRFQSNPNQPLAHFGTPLLVGPLDPKSAVDLIQEPMQFLGYRFADFSGPLRILSFTNYHPGLIQLFCQELLERIRDNKPPNKLPPYEIRQTDIEAVYRQVKERIKERFEWTLALDSSYQAIAWSMIYDQIEIRDSYSHTYTSSELLAKVRALLPTRFLGILLNNFIGLLDEMEGLGVLTRESSGYYRLRSPNVVRLMGSESEIETKLLELMDKPLVIRSSDEFHSIIERKVYSPFTYQQESRMYAFKSGVVLLYGGNTVFSKNIAEISPIPQFLERMIVPDEPGDSINKFSVIPLYISQGNDLITWLNKELSKDKERIFFYYSMEACPLSEMESLVAGAIRFTEELEKRRSKQVTKVFFGFNPNALRIWLELDEEVRQALEDKAEIYYPSSWTKDGVSHRLQLEEMLHFDDVCTEIMNATHGSYLLLNTIFDRMASVRGGIKDDPREQVKKLRSELENKSSAIVTNIIDDLAIAKYPLANRMLKYIVENTTDSVPVEYISPELINLGEVNTEKQYRAALQYLIRLNCASQDVDKQNNKVITVHPLMKKVI